MTLIQRHNNVVCPVGIVNAYYYNCLYQLLPAIALRIDRKSLFDYSQACSCTIVKDRTQYWSAKRAASRGNDWARNQS